MTTKSKANSRSGSGRIRYVVVVLGVLLAGGIGAVLVIKRQVSDEGIDDVLLEDLASIEEQVSLSGDTADDTTEDAVKNTEGESLIDLGEPVKTDLYPDFPFFESTPIIEGQQAYIAGPVEVARGEELGLVVFSHGSDTEVLGETSDEDFMGTLRYYASEFVPEGYIFAASNEHGANWGNKDARQDMWNLIEFAQNEYPVNDKVYLLGFSMGGLPTTFFLKDHPENVTAVALLAPTTYSTEWSSTEIIAVRSIPIKIWHGDEDVNVPLSLSVAFEEKFKNEGASIELVTIKGSDHWDLETRVEPVIDFFNSQG